LYSERRNTVADDTPIDLNTPCATPPDLHEFDDAFNAAEPAVNGEIPDGRYPVRVNDVTLDRSQKGAPMLTWDLVVLSGPHAHRHIFKNAVISKASLSLVKGNLELLGLKLERFSQLPQRLSELAGRTLEISKRAKDEYTNVYFNKRIEAPVGTPGRSDNVPF
jgi:hypothetical protein